MYQVFLSKIVAWQIFWDGTWRSVHQWLLGVESLLLDKHIGGWRFVICTSEPYGWIISDKEIIYCKLVYIRLKYRPKHQHYLIIVNGYLIPRAIGIRKSLWFSLSVRGLTSIISAKNDNRVFYLQMQNLKDFCIFFSSKYCWYIETFLKSLHWEPFE